jgi:hypothetical protein
MLSLRQVFILEINIFSKHFYTSGIIFSTDFFSQGKCFSLKYPWLGLEHTNYLDKSAGSRERAVLFFLSIKCCTL